jgi:hypothetical protein
MKQPLPGRSTRTEPGADRSFADTERRAPITPRGVPSEGHAPRLRAMFPARNAGRLLALFDVAIPFKGGQQLVVRRCRLMRGGDSTLWISGPTETWEKGGKIQYRALAVFPDGWKNAILNLALAEWAEYEKTGLLPQSETLGARRAA